MLAGFGGGTGIEGVVEALGDVAEVSGDEGGVVGEAVDTAETCNLDGASVGDDARECHLGEAVREPAEHEDGGNLQSEAEENEAETQAGAEVL